MINHKYSSNLTTYYVQADNGQQLIVLAERAGVVKAKKYGKQAFQKEIDQGKLTLEKIGDYNFDRLTYAQWLQSHAAWWRSVEG